MLGPIGRLDLWTGGHRELYEVEHGKIVTNACEIDVVHHCNLSCRGCSHLSPQAKPFFADPDQVYHDLSVLASCYHPTRVILLGGEPLLHPGLLHIIEAVRASGISEYVEIVTNGVLLRNMGDEFWGSVDRISVSLYPGYKLSAGQINGYRHRAVKHGTDLQIQYMDSFRELYSEFGAAEEDLVRRIYSTCKVIHVWRCHTVCDGHFYKCSPSAIVPRYLLGRLGEAQKRDGLKLADSGDLGDKMIDFLSGDQPLTACRHCLGGVGKRFAQTQEPQQACWIGRETEELIDWRQLRQLERRGLNTPARLEFARTLGNRALRRAPDALRLHPVFLRLMAALRKCRPV